MSSSGREDEDRTPVASRRAATAAADRPKRPRVKSDRRSPSYLSLRDREEGGGWGSRRRGRRYFDDQVERRSMSRSPSPLRRRRARWDDSYGDVEEPDRRSRSPSPSSRPTPPRRGLAPRSCRSRSRTRSQECENRSCCRRSRSPGDGDDGERSVSPTPPPQEDFDLRIYRPDDLFKCSSCFQLLSSPVYECVDGHVTCAVCHGSAYDGANERCITCGSKEYRQSRAIAGWLKSICFPCRNHVYGCPAFLPRHKVEAHERSCQYAPVFCPADCWRCDFGGPTDALERHVAAAHDGWTVVGVRYGEPLHVRVRPDPVRSLLRAEEDGALFFLCAKAADQGGSVLSMIHIRPDVAAPAADFTYEVKTPSSAAPGMQHRFQMQSTVWGTSLRDAVLYANPVSVKVPGSMLPREGAEQDSVEVRIVKVAPSAGDRDPSN